MILPLGSLTLLICGEVDENDLLPNELLVEDVVLLNELLLLQMESELPLLLGGCPGLRRQLFNGRARSVNDVLGLIAR